MPFTIIYRCPICGASLTAGIEQHPCIYCGKMSIELASELQCPNGHYVCAECRLLAARELPEHLLHNTETKPFVLANYVMAHPAIKQEAYGPDHHWIPTAVLLLTARNSGLLEISNPKLLSAIHRASKIPMGSCYLSGICGAVAGAGTAVSVMLNVTIHDKERSIVLEVTSKALALLAQQGGVRCCKEAVYTSIRAALDVLQSIPGFIETANHGKLETFFSNNEKIQCLFAKSMPDCKGSLCKYFPQNLDIFS